MATIAPKYTNVNFDQVLSDMLTILRYKEGPLADLTQNSFGRTLLELFSGNADLVAAWANNAFQEGFLETSQQLASAYIGSRMIGYSVRRPVPARAGFGIQLKRTGVYPTVRIFIPKNTVFTLNGSTIMTMEDTQWVYDRTQADFENGLTHLTSGRAVIMQGEIRNVTFYSNGTNNQIFNLPDVTFSNWFGDQDPNWQLPSTQNQRSKMYTSVSSDASLLQYNTPSDTLAGKIWWNISRRGLFDPTQPKIFKTSAGLVEPEGVSTNYTVLIDTSNDGTPRLIFGDGVVSAVPYGAINISYVSTLGALGNQTNVAGQQINPGYNNILITQEDGTPSDLTVDDLNFALTTDLSGGLASENPTSIKNNASSIFASLDSLGNRQSYLLYLKTRGDFKYANAYGEDFLSRASANNMVNLKYSNLVRFTVLKALYATQNGRVYPTDPSQYYIQGYKVNGLTYLWQYDYFLMPTTVQATGCALSAASLETSMTANKITVYQNGTLISNPDFISNYILTTFNRPNAFNQLSVFNANLQPKDFADDGSELALLLDDISRRGYLTLGGGQTSYAPPSVQDMTMDISISLFPGANFNDIRNLVREEIYTYLNDYTDFATPIYRSQIESVIMRQPDVAGVTVYFKARPNGYEGFNISTLPWLGDNTAVLVNQTGLDFIGFNIELTYDYTSTDLNGSSAVLSAQTMSFTVPDQSTIQQEIANYYNKNIADPATGNPRDNLTEAELNGFCAFIWSTMFSSQILYTIYQTKYLPAFQAGETVADQYWSVMQAMRGWYFSEGVLLFKDTDAISQMFESTANTLFNYFVYTLEYIKLVRNILGPVVANALVEKTEDCQTQRRGDLTKYSEGTEIVQFVIADSDIKLKTVNNAVVVNPTGSTANLTTQGGK